MQSQSWSISLEQHQPGSLTEKLPGKLEDKLPALIVTIPARTCQATDGTMEDFRKGWPRLMEMSAGIGDSILTSYIHRASTGRPKGVISRLRLQAVAAHLPAACEQVGVARRAQELYVPLPVSMYTHYGKAAGSGPVGEAS